MTYKPKPTPFQLGQLTQAMYRATVAFNEAITKMEEAGLSVELWFINGEPKRGRVGVKVSREKPGPRLVPEP